MVFTIASSTSYNSRPPMSVAVLSVFVVPMTEAFSWSRGLFAGAVGLGGLCAFRRWLGVWWTDMALS